MTEVRRDRTSTHPYIRYEVARARPCRPWATRPSRPRSLPAARYRPPPATRPDCEEECLWSQHWRTA